MFCPQGHGSWAGEECGLCGAQATHFELPSDAESCEEEEHYAPAGAMSPMTRSLLVDMNSLFDDWASSRVY